MGKRELLIALAFIVAGTIAFQFSAPPAKESSTGFSFSKLIDSAKREMRGNETYSAPPRTTTYAVGDDITELRLTSSSGPVSIVGEARADVAMELRVFTTGGTEAAAIATANKTAVKEDRLGGVLTLRIVFPTEETQSSQIVLKVPQRLGVRLDGTRETTISHVRSVEFTSVNRGATQIDHIAEHVTGEQLTGTITLASIGSLKMTFTRTRARLSDLSGEISLDVRDGDTEIVASRGPLVIEERRGDITIRDHKGTVRVTGQDGRVRIEGATDEELRVSWHDPANVHLDAVATKGDIDANDWGVATTKDSTEARVDALLGTKSATAPRLSLRNQGANIVLKKSSKK